MKNGSYIVRFCLTRLVKGRIGRVAIHPIGIIVSLAIVVVVVSVAGDMYGIQTSTDQRSQSTIIQKRLLLSCMFVTTPTWQQRSRQKMFNRARCKRVGGFLGPQRWVVLTVRKDRKDNADNRAYGHVLPVVSVVVDSGDSDKSSEDQGREDDDGLVDVSAFVKEVEFSCKVEGKVSETTKGEGRVA